MEKIDQSPRRKVKFPPKASHRKRPPTLETEDDDDDGKASQTQYLLRRATENLGNRGKKVEKKSSVQVAFGPGASSSTTAIRTYGAPKAENTSKRKDLEPEVSGHEEPILPLPMDVEEDGASESFIGATSASMATKEDYKEPWDYQYSYYPTTLPLRAPYSGDPERLDEAEFGEAAMNREYDENTIVPASDLGFLDESGGNTMYLFQFPAHLPITRHLATSTGKEKVGGSGDLKQLPGGSMGKLLIYKSGAIKLRLADTLYDVSSGVDCSFAQNVVAINTKEGHCCELGDIGKRVVVTPDIASLLKSVSDSA